MAETVPRVGLAVVVAQFAVQVQGLLAVGQCLLVHSEQGSVPADRVKCACLSGAMIGSPVEVEGLLGVLEGFKVTVFPAEYPSETVVGVGLANAVAEFAVQAQRVLEMGVGVLVGTAPAAGTAEQAVGVGLCGRIVRVDRSAQRCRLGGGVVVPVPAPFEVDGHDRRDLPGVGVEPHRGGQRGGRQQHGALGVEPGQCLLVVGEVLGHGAGLQRG